MVVWPVHDYPSRFVYPATAEEVEIGSSGQY